MRYSMSTRLLSLILAAALLIPCIPQGSATASEPELAPVTETVEVVETTETAETAESTEASEETEAPEVTEVVEETEATEETKAVEETEATEAAEAIEKTEATEATEAVEETEATEATEAVEEAALSHGFLGMPEGYQLSEEDRNARTAAKEHKVLETLSGLIPGENYAENQILVSAETEEEALLIAQAYCGELTDFGYGIALITLTEATTQEAVEASMDESLNLPVASPNYKYRIEPIISEPEAASSSTFSFNAPTRKTWNDWIHDTLKENADPALLHPHDSNYQYMHDVVDSYAAWGVNTGDKDIVVAVIDSGVDISHPDLHNIHAYDVGLGTTDDLGHGTHVSGIIAAALGNAEGGAGIAPNVSVTSYRAGLWVTEYGETYFTFPSLYLSRAIKAAADNGAHIINMSLGGPSYSTIEQEAIDYAYEKGVTVVAAMGNDGSNTVNYPAAYDHVIAVAATDRSNNRAWYSNYGDWCDISAPGSGIYSTLPGDDYEAWDGTSMAAPVVTGAIALYMSAKGYNPGPDHIEKVLESSAVKCKDKGMGAGIVNIANMLDDKPEAPAYGFVYEGKEYEPEGSVLPCETSLYFATPGNDEKWFILYTLDGKTPSVKDGQIINGSYYKPGTPIPLSPYVGGSVTVKAMQVSSLGIPGKVLTLKLKVADSTKVTSVSIEGPSRLAAGKKGQFVATVYPTDKADQDVVWSIVSPNRSDIKIDKKGVLTTPKNYFGTVTVKATSAADGRYCATANVDVEIVNPVSKIALNLKTANIYVNQSEKLSIAQLEDSKKNPISQEDAGIQWTSSNPKVATVDGNGNVKALSKGKSTITCKALDGSNKSAKCTVTVKQQVESIEISGNTAISPKESTALKAAVSPATANTKSVTWSVDAGSLRRGVSISSSGKVSVPADYDYRNYPQITVYAAAKDGQGADDSHTLTVQPKITGLTIEMQEDYVGLAQGAEYKADKKGNLILNTVHLFSLDLTEHPHDDTLCALKAVPTGGIVDIIWSSSNPSVASISDNGNVTAHKAGTVKITAKALDGSKKTASVTIKVGNPVSYMEIKTSAPQMTNYTPYIGIGKSVSNSVAFGNTYGVPSNKKVTWDFNVSEVKMEWHDDGAYFEEVHVKDWTNTFKTNKLVTVSSSGKVSVKSDVKDYWYEINPDEYDTEYTDNYTHEFMLELYAYAEDGTDTMTSKRFILMPTTTKMGVNMKSGYASPNDVYVNVMYSDQHNAFFMGYEYGFIATSSNPKVASVTRIYPNGYYNFFDVEFATGKRGTAKITIKATDGSNKSCSFTVKVK